MPGYGQQGAAANDVKPCFNHDGLGAIISASRSIMLAYKNEKYNRRGEDYFAESACNAAIAMRDDLRRILDKK